MLDERRFLHRGIDLSRADMIARLYGDAHIPLLFFIERGDVAAGRDKSAGSFSDRLQRTLDAVKYISPGCRGQG